MTINWEKVTDKEIIDHLREFMRLENRQEINRDSKIVKEIRNALYNMVDQGDKSFGTIAKGFVISVANEPKSTMQDIQDAIDWLLSFIEIEDWE